jgi:hypothetical protein
MNKVILGSAILMIALGMAALSGLAAPQYVLPDETGSWTVSSIANGRLPASPIPVIIEGVGRFDVNPSGMTSVRSDIFRPGRGSVFDLLVLLSEQEAIELAYHYDETLETHVIDSIDGLTSWWYEAHYSGGQYEPNAVRMDLYPVKDGLAVMFYQASPDWLASTKDAFREEVARRQENDGAVVLSRVIVRAQLLNLDLSDVRVTAHDARPDVFQPGVVTAFDVILSLGEQGRLQEVGYTWYTSIGRADPVDTFYVEMMATDDVREEAYGRCGFVFYVGASGSQREVLVHIPADTRILVSPEQVMWRWICLGSRD